MLRGLNHVIRLMLLLLVNIVLKLVIVAIVSNYGALLVGLLLSVQFFKLFISGLQVNNLSLVLIQ